MAKLIVYSGDAVVREVPLVKEPFFIGRALDCDLVVMDHLVSRKHARLERDQRNAGAWKVLDLGSSNGVYVNEQRIAGERLLADGDRVRIGSATIEFKDERPRPARPSQVSIAFTPADEPGGMAVMKSVCDLRPDYTNVPRGSPATGMVSVFKERDRTAGVKSEAVAKEGLHFFILYQLAGAINSATSIDELFERSLEMLVEALDAGVGAVLLLDRASGELVPRTSKDRRGRSAPGSGELKLSRTIVNKVIKDKVAFLTRDALIDNRFAAGKSVAAMQIRSAICVPIWDAGEVEGVLYIDNSNKPGAFTEDDQNLVVAVGHQLAVALKREEMIEKLKREAVHRSNLERYHSPDVVEMILRQQGEVALEVKETDVTVLFADIEGFTKLSERLAPADVARILNLYFEGATEAIFRNGGQVNKYIGDAILAVFGAPIPNPDHAVNACRAALEMLEALRRFREQAADHVRFRLRIGVNSGPVVAGNIGAARRMEYTVIGNTVNVASRLEKIALPDGVAIGPATEALVRGRGFEVASIGPVRLKGLASDLEIYQLLGYARA